MNPEQLGIPELLGLTESEARARVIMLQSMKRKLICDWHPVIDKLLGDWERGLKYIESQRVKPDDDDNSLMRI